MVIIMELKPLLMRMASSDDLLSVVSNAVAALTEPADAFAGLPGLCRRTHPEMAYVCGNRKSLKFKCRHAKSKYPDGAPAQLSHQPFAIVGCIGQQSVKYGNLKSAGIHGAVYDVQFLASGHVARGEPRRASGGVSPADYRRLTKHHRITAASSRLRCCREPRSGDNSL